MNIETKSDVVKTLLSDHFGGKARVSGTAFASANIALCKYWGKRNAELQLPMTSSLSISLSDKGTHTQISLAENHDRIVLNGSVVSNDSKFAKPIIDFLNLFRLNDKMHFSVDTINNVPTSTGLGSSASGFAALVQALNDLFLWGLNKTKLSILARLGSGSACRSLWPGFVKWQMGKLENGMDSFAQALPYTWPQLRLGLLVLSSEPKKISSREAMFRTVETSPFYALWPKKVVNDLIEMEKAIEKQDFHLFGKIVESNALAMHACILSSSPPMFYATSETLSTIQEIWRLRADGLPVYFTQDAGPNLTLLFLEQYEQDVRNLFSEVGIVNPFGA